MTDLLIYHANGVETDPNARGEHHIEHSLRVVLNNGREVEICLANGAPYTSIGFLVHGSGVLEIRADNRYHLRTFGPAAWAWIDGEPG